MADNQNVIVSERKKFPGIWFVPIIALLIGIWMVINHYRSLGPEVHIEFKTAEGIEPEKTKVKSLDVEVGVVESVRIKDDLKGVVVVVRIKREAAELLRSDTQFWVVRPRVTGAGVSGLGTLLSGAYIELSPGLKQIVKKREQHVKGLDEIPATPLTAPGLHFTLSSDESTSMGIGDPITFRGYEVGNVEQVILDPASKKIAIHCFIKQPFDSLVNSNTRFWNSSGIAFNATPGGFSVRMQSLTSLLRGGVSFRIPKGSTPGAPVENNAQFVLYPDEDSIDRNPYKNFQEYLLFFETSVQGLHPKAPVLYRGIQVGTVKDVSFKYVSADDARLHGRGIKIPVVIRIEPGRWSGDDSAEAVSRFNINLEKGIEEGLRASIKLDNLITGARIITIDFYDDLKPASIGKFEEFSTIPTVSTGIEGIERKISNLLDKFNQLPLEKLVGDADIMLEKITDTVATADQAMQDLQRILENKDTQQIPESINATLNELKLVLEGLSPDSDFYRDLSDSLEQLNQTMRNIEEVTYTIDTKPNSLIFSKPKKQDTQPEAPKQ